MSAIGGENGDISSGPFSLISGQYQKALRMFELFSAFNDRPSLVESAEDVLAMPPEKRFTESHTVLFRFMGIENIREAEPDDLPSEVVDFFEQTDVPKFLNQLHQLLDQEFRQTQQKILDQVLNDRSNAEDYLITVVFLEKLREIHSELNYLLEKEGGRKQKLEVLSQHVVFLSHFTMIASGEKTDFDEEFLQDIVRYEYYDAKRRCEEPAFDLNGMDAKEIERRILLQGAIQAYGRLPISVSRGAELANRSRQEFEEALIDQGMQPRYGPDSADELRRGPGLSKPK